MSLIHHASAVAIAGRAILIEGPPGSGKSSLALALMDRGATLIADDGVTLDPVAGRLHASPALNIAGLIEVRNVGIIRRETAASVPVALILRLDREAPRFIDAAEQVILAGVPVPLVRLWPDSPVLALRAEIALAQYGAG